MAGKPSANAARAGVTRDQTGRDQSRERRTDGFRSLARLL